MSRIAASGQLLFLERGQNKDGDNLFMVMGLVRLPSDAPFKNNCRYVFASQLENGALWVNDDLVCGKEFILDPASEENVWEKFRVQSGHDLNSICHYLKWGV